MGILDKIAEVEAEINRTQKNKATEYHLGTLKVPIASLLDPTKERLKSLKHIRFFLKGYTYW